MFKFNPSGFFHPFLSIFMQRKAITSPQRLLGSRSSILNQRPKDPPLCAVPFLQKRPPFFSHFFIDFFHSILLFFYHWINKKIESIKWQRKNLGAEKLELERFECDKNKSIVWEFMVILFPGIVFERRSRLRNPHVFVPIHRTFV